MNLKLLRLFTDNPQPLPNDIVKKKCGVFAVTFHEVTPAAERER